MACGLQKHRLFLILYDIGLPTNILTVGYNLSYKPIVKLSDILRFIIVKQYG